MRLHGLGRFVMHRLHEPARLVGADAGIAVSGGPSRALMSAKWVAYPLSPPK